MSTSNSGSRWLIAIIVILVLALVGAICVGAAGLVFLTQQNAVGQNVPSNPLAPGQTPRPAATRAAPSQQGPSGNVLRLPGPGGDPTTLDPALSSDADSAQFVYEIFSGLVTLDQNLKIIPDLAQNWDVSEDRSVYTFHLRQGAKFQDGRPITAQDFKYSLERALNPATASPTAETYLGDIVGAIDRLNGKAQSVSGIQVVDDYTLKITIDAPKTYFLAKLTYPTAFVVDKNNVERGGRTWTDQPNGSGPYKVKEYVRGQRLILVKNDNYYLDPKPQIPEVDFILGGGSPMTMYENGDLDSTYVTISDIERVSDPSSPLNKELTTSPYLETYFLVFNVKKPPFDDPKVRQAFALAIDRQKIIDVVFKKMVLPANTIVPPDMPGYNESLPKIPYDPAQAKQLLAQSKYAGKLPDITWNTVGAGGSTSQYVQAIAGMLKDNLGVNVSIQQTDPATFYAQLDNPNRDFQLFDIGWVADYVDPQDFVDILYRSGNRAQNWPGYSNPAVDKLLDQAAVEKDNATRFKLYNQAEQMILADYPVVPLWYDQQFDLTKPYVKGLVYPPLVIERLRYVSLSR